jgi:Creatinase/Prolidase N-terminal domain
MSRLERIELPEFGGLEEDCPPLPTAEYQDRLERLTEAMAEEELDFLVVYADREHSANLCFLTGFDPRFEEALLLLDRRGRRLLLVGNECLGYLPDGDLGIEAELFQDFSLLGQPRDSSRPLASILADFGIGSGSRIGCIGWKYYDSPGAIELPAFIVDLLRRLGGAAGPRNAGRLLMDPERGLRTVSTASQIARFEYAAVRCSESVRAAIRNLRPGVRERDLEEFFQPGGLPLSMHNVVSFGEEQVRKGFASPGARRARLGDPYVVSLGVWGSLSARAGVVAAGPADLDPQLAEFYPRFTANYFNVVAAWYEALDIGVEAGAVYAAAEAKRDDQLFRFALNTGHLTHLDEWLHSPFSPGSTVALRSGMALQADLIPLSRGPYCYSNAEDGLVLADETLAARIASAHPRCWARMQERRRFMREALGIRLADCVLPLANTPAWLPPYALSTDRVLAASS